MIAAAMPTARNTTNAIVTTYISASNATVVFAFTTSPADQELHQHVDLLRLLLELALEQPD